MSNPSNYSDPLDPSDPHRPPHSQSVPDSAEPNPIAHPYSSSHPTDSDVNTPWHQWSQAEWMVQFPKIRHLYYSRCYGRGAGPWHVPSEELLQYFDNGALLNSIGEELELLHESLVQLTMTLYHLQQRQSIQWVENHRH